MAKIIVAKLGVKREKGRIYWISKDMRLMSKPRRSSGDLRIHSRPVGERKEGYLYYYKDGSVYAVRGRQY